MPGALTGDRQYGARINGRHRHTYRFKFCSGKTFTQQYLQVSADAIRCVGVSIGGGFTEQKNPVRIGGFLRGKSNGLSGTGKCRGEKPVAEFVVRHIKTVSVDLDSAEKAGVI